MAKHRRLTAFKMDEISGVDRPAQKPALATLTKAEGAPMKRVLLKATEHNRRVDSILKRYIDPAEGAKGFKEILQCYEDDQKYAEVSNKTWPLVSALDTSLRSVIADRDVEDSKKHLMMRTAVEEFLAAIKQEWPEIDEVLDKSLADDGKVSKSEEEQEMLKTEELEKKLTALATQVADLAKAGTASDEKAAELAKKLEKAEADLKAATDELEKAKGKGKDDMDGDEKTFYAGMKDDKKKKAFSEMTKADRAAEMKKAAELAKAGDETLEVDGLTFLKSETGPAMFGFLKAQVARNDTLSKRLETETDARQTAELTKRAETDLAGYAGELATKVSVLKAIDKMPAADKAELLKMLSVGGKAVGAAFQTLGKKADGTEIEKADAQSARTAFTTKVSEIKKRDSLTQTKAMEKAAIEHPDLFKAYQEAPAAN